jgi:RNA polymerase sigma-70 factor, ECF subfamily
MAIDRRTGGNQRNANPGVKRPSYSAEARAEADRAFERLYRGHRDDVFRAALRDLKNVHDAEDVTQAAFVDAYRAVLRGSSPEAPRAWLLAIAENVRRRRFRRTLSRPREEPLDEAAAPDTAESPLVAQDLRAALAELTPAQREVFALRELSGLSYDEIADQTGTTVASVQMALFRARRTLRACLEPPTVARRGRIFLPPLPGWLTHLAGRPDLALLSPRGFAAAGAAALAIGGFAAQVDEPRAASREATVALQQPAETVPAPVGQAAAPAPPPPRAPEPVARATRPAPAAAPSRTQPATTVPAESADQPTALAPETAPPAADTPAAVPPPSGGPETPTAAPPTAPTAPTAPATPPTTSQTPTIVVTVPLTTPAIRLGALEVPALSLPPLTVPPLALPLPLPQLPDVVVPPIPLPQVQPVVEPVLAPVLKQVEGAAGDAGIVAPPLLPLNPLAALPPALPSLRVTKG